MQCNSKYAKNGGPKGAFLGIQKIGNAFKNYFFDVKSDITGNVSLGEVSKTRYKMMEGSTAWRLRWYYEKE